MQISPFEALLNSSRSRNNASKAPKSTILRLEALESRELLDAASLVSEVTPLATALDSQLFNDDALLDLSSAETLAANASTTWIVSLTDDNVSVEGTLRHALANAEDGDTITFDSSLQGATITLNGTQLEIDKSIMIDASNLWDEATQTPGITIDGNQTSRVFYAADVVVEFVGLTIANGYADDIENGFGCGGGVFMSGGDAYFTNCAVVGNSSDGDGGGVCVYDYGFAMFVNCVVSGNTACVDEYGDFDGGGGVFIIGYGEFTNCTISGNASVEGGGGVYVCGSSEFTDCSISENNSDWGAGGAYILGSYSVRNCIISYNASDYGAGGVAVSTGYYDDGVFTASGYFENSAVIGNYSGGDRDSAGGLIVSGYGDFMNCTISGNSSESGVGGIYFIPYDDYYGEEYYKEASSGGLVNTIIAENSGDDVCITYYDYDNEPFVSSVYGYNSLSSFVDWPDDEYLDYNYVYNPNLPLFADAANGDYTLAENSQAIDLGDGDYVSTTYDLAGNIRVRNDVVDLGAYEYQYGTKPRTQLASPTVTGAATSTTVTLTWDAVPNASGYEIDFDGSTYTVGVSETSFVFSGLEISTSYDFVVRAVGNGVDYANSSDVSITVATGLVVSSVGDSLNDPDSLRYLLSIAEDGDTITFAPSLKGATITLGGTQLKITKSITIDASNLWDEATQTPGITIDGNRQSRVFYATASAVEFNGLAIVNGKVSGSGGGIYVSGGGTFTNCAISGNTSSSSGGGVYVYDGGGTFTNCAISDNSGGGVYVEGGGGTFTECTISDNSGYGVYVYGGGTFTNCAISGNSDYGVYLYGDGDFLDCTISGNSDYGVFLSGDVAFTNCAISENTGNGVYISGGGTFTECTISDNSGRGVYVYDGGGTFTECTISDNSGYGVYVYGGGGTFTECTISDNSGGGVYVKGGGTFTNCAISGNTSSSSGGGVYVYDGGGTFTNCAISGNTSSSSGGGVYVYDGGGTFTNCAISGNSATINGGGVFLSSKVGTFRNCTISGNSTSYDAGGGGVYLSRGGTFYNSIVALNYGGNFRGGSYAFNSTLRDKNPLFVRAPIFEDGNLVNADDLDLHLAPYSPYIDYPYSGYLGAYEFTGERTARPQYNLVTTLDDEFDLTNEAISLREAIYMSTSDETITFADDLSGTIALNSELFADSVKIDGDNRITLDGQGAHRVLYASGDVELNGVVVTNGNTTDDGGGVFAYGVGTFTNCTISGNAANGDGGGGVYLNRSGTFTNCAISGNSSSNGGGVLVYNGRATFDGCTITENSADSKYGGGVYLRSGGTLTNCTISGNSSKSKGGGVYVYSGGATFTNCAISGNVAYGDYSRGGGVYVYSGGGTFTDCAISGNSSTGSGNFNTSYGGGVCIDDGDSAFTNCAISGNSSGRYGGGVYLESKGTFTNCAISGNSGSDDGGGVYIDGDDGTFNGCEISGNSASNGGGVYIDDGDSAFTNCTISGNFSGGGVCIRNYDSHTFRNSIVALNYGGNIKGTYAAENSLIGENPLFVCAPIFEDGKLINADDLDLHLAPYSPYIDYLEDGYLGAYEFTGERTARPQYDLVTTLDDEFDLTNEAISLREAIYMATSDETITFAVGLSGTIALNSELFAGYSIKIDGDNRVTLDGQGAHRVLYASGNVELNGIDAINGNTTGNGGGVYVFGDGTFTDCTINGNFTNRGDGGGVYVRLVGTFTNCAISGNSASYSGGGVYVNSDSGTFANCTISGNSADYGGGVYVYSGTTTLYNSIVALNSSDDIHGNATGYNTLSSYTNWSNASESDVVNYEYNPSMPLFSDVANGDYRLAIGSQAIDKGNNAYLLEGLETDLDDAPRILGESVDLGAYEALSSFTLSQFGYFQGNVTISGTIFDLAAPALLTWISNGEKTVIGTYNNDDSFVWGTTQIQDGAGALLVEYQTQDGKSNQTSFYAVILNDPNVTLWRGGAINENVVFDADHIHLVAGALNVASDATVTIAENAVVKFASKGFINVASGAKLAIRENAILTRLEDDSVGGDTNLDGANTTPKCGAGYFSDAGTLEIAESAELRYMSIELSGTLSGDQTLLSGLVYRITNNLVVPDGVTLTILPGAILKFDSDNSLIVQSGGLLNARGNLSQPIVFTSVYDSDYGGQTLDDSQIRAPKPGDWRQIEINGGSAIFDHAMIRFSGSPTGDSSDGALYVSSGSAEFNNGEILYSLGVAAHGSGDALRVTNSIISEAQYATHCGTYVNCVIDSVDCLCNTNDYYENPTSFVNCVISRVSEVYWSLFVPSYAYKNNLFYNPVGVGKQTFSAVGSNGNIWANPKFRDADALDFRLTVGSPCIDAGNGELAPEFDKVGAPRADDPYVDNTGTPTASGAHCDIGAFEFVDDAVSNLDLTPIDIQTSASANVGGELTVQWTIRNDGAVEIDGTWTDAFYLITDHGERVYIQEVEHVGSMLSGDTQTFYATLKAPNALPGEYRVEVLVNSNRAVFEGANGMNNSFVSTSKVALTIPELEFPAVDVALFAGKEKLYRLVVPAGESYYLTANSEEVAIRVREDYVPTSTLFDADSETYNGKSFVKFDATEEARVFYVSLSTKIDVLATITQEEDATAPPIADNLYDRSTLALETDFPVTRVGRVSQARVFVTNNGTESVYAPLLYIMTQDSNSIGWTRDELETRGTSVLSAFVLSNRGDVKLIKPGETIEISFYYMYQEGMKITAQFYKAKPTSTYDHSSTPVWATYADYCEAIYDAARIFAQRGKIERDAAKLQVLAQALVDGEDCVGISGSVIRDGSGSPVADRDLVATWASLDDEGNEISHSSYATTDVNGYFSFDYLPATEVTISDEAANVERVFDLADGADRVGVRLVEEPLVSLTGRVKTPDGALLEGVVVKANGADESVFFAETDAFGVYVFPEIAVGEWTISLVGSGVYAQVEAQTVTLDQPTTTVNFAVAQGYNVSGFVVDSEGIGVADLRVQFTNFSDEGYLGRTLGNGAFSIENIPAGEYNVAIYNELNKLLRATKLIVDSDMSTTLPLNDETDHSLFGRIVGASGAPLPGLTVLLEGNGIATATQADENGEYRFDNLSDGVYKMRIVGLNDEYTVDLDALNGEANPDIALPYKATLEGSFTDANGTPLPDATLSIERDGKTRAIAVDQNGKFLVLLSETGSYSIWGASSGGFAKRQTVAVAAGGNTWTPQFGTGVAQINVGGIAEFSDENIKWTLWLKTGDEYDQIELSGLRDSFGNFQLQGLDAGEYYLTASCGHYRASKSFAITNGSTTTISLEFVKSAVQSVVAMLKVPTGFDGDLSQACAFVYDSQMNMVSAYVSFDENGVGKLTFDSSGVYTIVVFCGRYVLQTSKKLDGADDSIELQLQRGANIISGSATFEGVSSESACVYVTDDSGMIIGYGFTDENGEFHLAVLKTGACKLRVVADGAEEIEISITIIAGENEVDDVELTTAEEDVAAIIDALADAGILGILDEETLVELSNYFIWWPGSPDSDDLTEKFKNLETKIKNLPDADPCCKCNESKVQEYETNKSKLRGNIDDLRIKIDDIKANESKQKELTISIAGTIAGIALKFAPAGLFWHFLKVSVSLTSLIYAIHSYNSTLLDMRSIVNGTTDSIDDISAVCIDLGYTKTFFTQISNGVKKLCGNIGVFFSNLINNLSEGRLRSIPDFIANMGKQIDALRASATFPVPEVKWSPSFRESIDISRLNGVVTARKLVVDRVASLVNVMFTIFDVLLAIKDANQLIKLVDEHTSSYIKINGRIDTTNSAYESIRSMAEEAKCHCEDCKCDEKLCKCKTGGECTCGGACHCLDEPAPPPGPVDPNAIDGPVGGDFVYHDAGTEDEPYLVIDGANWVDASEQQFRIYFENKSTAEAAAQEIFVTTTLPEEFDESALQISDINIGNEVYALTSEYELGPGVWLFKQASTGDYIKVSFDYDRQTRQAKWYLRSYVLSTYDNFPANVYAGFLPPNNKEVGDGEGYVSFRVTPKDDLTTGTRIETYATIVFDTEDPIDTNVWVNTLDVDAPTLTSVAAAFNDETREFAVDWSGEDVGSGVDAFDVFVSVDGGETFAKWLMKTAETSGVYVVPSDASGDYVFKAVVYDGAGNSAEDVTTSIRVDFGDTTRLSSPVVTSAATASTITLSWNAVDRASGYEIDFNGTTYSLDASETSRLFAGLEATTAYNFTVRAVGNNVDLLNSNDVALTVETNPLQRLATPTLSVVATNFDSISVSWNSIPNATSYSIYYAVATDSPEYARASLGASKTSFTIRNLDPETRYYVAIRADGDGFEYASSYRSREIAVETKSAVPQLDAPTLTATATDSTIALSWNVVPGAVKYEIEFNGSTYSFGPTKTSYTLTNLIYSTPYSVVARAVGDGTTCVTSEDAALIVETTAVSTTGLTRLARPVLTATASDFKTISVEWEAIPNAASYTISYAVKSGSLFYKTATIAADQTSYTIRGLDVGTTYYLKIRANGDGVNYNHSPQSSTITAKTKKVEQLARPTIRVVAATSESLDLAWNAVPHASSYTLSYAVKATNPVYTQVEVDAETTSYVLSGLRANTSYYVKVRANGDGVEYKSSSQSPTVTATTDFIELATPEITGATATATTITITWNAVSGASGYELLCGDRTIANIEPTATSYTVTGLSEKTSYALQLKALGDHTTSLDSDYASTTATTNALLQLARPVLTVSATTDSTIAVAWDAIPHASSYTLSYAVKASSPVYTEIELSASTTSYEILELLANTSYYVKVRADGDGVEYKNSAQSSTVTAKTKSDVVALATPEITGATATATTITITWNAVSGASGYELVCGDRTIANIAASATSYTVTGLSEKTEYALQLKALGDHTRTLDSDYASATATTNALLQLARPALTVSATTDSTIAVVWDAISHASGYTLSYAVKASAPVYTEIALSASTTSFEITGLLANTSYYVKVRANGDGVAYKNSAQSPTVAAKTAFTILATPTITETTSTAATVAATWSAVPNASGYEIVCGDRTATVDASATSYTFAGLAATTSYSVQVKALGNGSTTLDSEYSEAATIATTAIRQLPRPTLTATATTDSSITVEWATIPGASSYTISYAVKASTPDYRTASYGASKTSATIRNLEPGTSYYLKIRANGDNVEFSNSPQSPTITAKTAAANVAANAPATTPSGTCPHCASAALDGVKACLAKLDELMYAIADYAVELGDESTEDERAERFLAFEDDALLDETDDGLFDEFVEESFGELDLRVRFAYEAEEI